MINFGLFRMLLEQGTGCKENRKITNGNKGEMKLLRQGLSSRSVLFPFFHFLFSFLVLVPRAYQLLVKSKLDSFFRGYICRARHNKIISFKNYTNTELIVFYFNFFFFSEIFSQESFKEFFIYIYIMLQIHKINSENKNLGIDPSTSRMLSGRSTI